MTKIKLSILFTAALACPSISADDEHPQEPSNREEVLVSAFREEAAQDMDSSVSVLDSENIESAALANAEELVSLVPNMKFSGEGSRARYFQLRGIGELEQYEGAPNPSVGFIVDDIDLSGVAGVTGLFDIQQFEILRGPQATRFGANAIAGLVYVQSADAKAGQQSEFKLTLGSDDTVSAGVSLGAALGDSMHGRFSIHRFGNNGFYNNVSLGVDDSNERDELVVRAKLQWDLGKGWKAKLSSLFANFNNGYDAWSPENKRTTFSNNPGRDEQSTTGASLKISGPLSKSVDFVAISGFASSDILFSYDGEWGDADYWAPYVYDFIYTDDRKRETLSQEFRFLSSPQGDILDGRTDWIIGLYAQSLDESNDIHSAGIYDDSTDAPFSFCAPCLSSTLLDSAYESSNLAVFGKLDLDVSDRISLSAGVRIEKWKADYSDRFTDEIYGDPLQPVSNTFHPRENLWGGDFSLDFQLTDSSRIYGKLSRGYKAGGFNPSLSRALGPGSVVDPGSIVYEPEVLWNYEFGLKGLWLDDRLNGDFSMFYMDREDMQLRSSAQFTDNPNDFIFITSNAEGHSYGLEASLGLELSSTWSMHANLGLLESRVDAYSLEREADIPGQLAGREFAHAPPYTLNLGLSYQGLTDDGNWVARLDFNASGSYFFDYSHDEKAGGRQTVNLRVGRQWQQWEIHAWVRNLFDEEYHTRGFSFGLVPAFFERTRWTRLGDPRHYGLTVNYKY